MDTGPHNAAHYPDTFSPSQAAKSLGVSKTRVLQMLKADPPELVGHQDDQRRWRIPASHVEDLRRRRDQEHRPRPEQDHVEADTSRELVEALRDEIAHLRKESERKDTIIMSLSQSNAEQARTIRAIEAPADAKEATDAPESVTPDPLKGAAPPADTGPENRSSRPAQRPWWRRIIGQ